MPAFKITSVEWDFSDNNEYPLTKEEIDSLMGGVYDKIFLVDDEEEIVDAVSGWSGWCILNLDYVQVPSVEVTVYGLYGGEINNTDNLFEVPITGKKTDLAIIRAVKSELGWNNIRCIKTDYGDSIRLEPSGIPQCADIEVVY